MWACHWVELEKCLENWNFQGLVQNFDQSLVSSIPNPVFLVNGIEWSLVVNTLVLALEWQAPVMVLPELEMNQSTYPRISFFRGISCDVRMVNISMVFRIFFRVKCIQLELNMGNTFSLSDNYLTIDKHERNSWKFRQRSSEKKGKKLCTGKQD